MSERKVRFIGLDEVRVSRRCRRGRFSTNQIICCVVNSLSRLLGGDPEVCVLVLTRRDNLAPGPEPTHRRGYENRTEN